MKGGEGGGEVRAEGDAAAVHDLWREAVEVKGPDGESVGEAGDLAAQAVVQRHELAVPPLRLHAAQALRAA